MGLHAAGDTIVALNTSDVTAIGMSSSSIGLSRAYRGITYGQDISSDSDRDFTYRGVNLECLSPAHCRGALVPLSTDWEVTCVRRSRTDGEWRDYVDVGLGESSEAYELDIFSSNTYSTLKRTLSSATPSFLYTTAQQTTDFGATQNFLYAKLYQLSSTVGRGYPAVLSLSSGLNDPYWSFVSLLMPMTGLNGGVLFPDSKGHTPITVNGNAQTSTARSPLSIGSSGLFDGSGDYLSLPSSSDWSFGTGDFTVEAWVYITAYPGGGVNNDMTIFGSFDTGFIFLYLDNTTGKPTSWDGTVGVTSSTAVPLSTWTFVQFVRQSGTLRVAINGSQTASATHTTNISATTNYNVGGMGAVNLRYFNGNISQLRVTKYARTIQLPTAPFPAY